MRRIFLVWLVVTACHKPAGKDFFGPQVSPPGVLAQIRPEMTLEQVKAIVPDAKNDPGKGLMLGKPASNVTLYAIMDDDRVVYTYVDYVADDAMAVLTQAWGPPDKEPDRDDAHDVAWRSTATGWRAGVFCGHGTEDHKLPPFCTIRFHPYLPLDNMFAVGAVAPPGALAKATLRMPLAQLQATTHLAGLTDKPIQTLARALDYDGVFESLGIVDGRLFMLDYKIPEIARAAIEKAWGPPKIEDDRALWFDAKTGWRAELWSSAGEPHELRLEFARYQPFAAQLEQLESLVAAPTIADAKTAHPELDWEIEKSDHDELVLYVPCTELSEPASCSTRAEGVSLFGGRAVNAIVGHLDAQRRDEIVELLTKRWGAPKADQRESSISYDFPKHGVLSQLGRSLTLDLGADL